MKICLEKSAISKRLVIRRNTRLGSCDFRGAYSKPRGSSGFGISRLRTADGRKTAGVWAGLFLVHGSPEDAVMLLDTFHVLGRLDEGLKDRQKGGRVFGLRLKFRHR